MAIKCPYCFKKLGGIKSVYGHWAFCSKYKDFVEKNGKEARLPFKWVGYVQRIPKNWVNRKASQKSVDKPKVKTDDVKSS